MFSNFDHLKDTALVRVHRFLVKLKNDPDLSQININLFVGGATEIESLSKYNIKSILDLREEKNDNQNKLKKYSIDYLQIKIPDRSFPSVQDSEIALLR